VVISAKRKPYYCGGGSSSVSSASRFALTDQGAETRIIQDYLEHRNIQHIVRYTASNPARFDEKLCGIGDDSQNSPTMEVRQCKKRPV
jgi:hypothetical protein